MAVAGKRKPVEHGQAVSGGKAHEVAPLSRAPATKATRDRARAPEDFKTSMLNIRVKAELKEQATATLEQLGISLPEAVRVFLGRVVSEQAFPFALEVPNAETAAALRESSAAAPRTFASTQDLFDALEKGGER